MIHLTYYITQRQKKLLDLLSRESVVTGEVLANLLSITSRTVRNEISTLNTIFNHKVIISTSKGYSIESKYFSLLKQTFCYSDEDNLRIQLIWKIFCGNCSNQTSELAEEYYVTPAVIHQLIRSISETLSLYQLQLVKKGLFFQVDGSEFARRIFLNTMILADAHSHLFDINTYNVLFENINMAELQSVILEILFQNNIHPEQVNLDSLTLNIAITLERLQRHQKMNYVMLQLPFLTESPEYRSALAIADYFVKRYHFEVSDNDMQYLYLLVFGQSKHRYENLLEPGFIQTVNIILKKTFQQFNLVCPYEPILENLAYHIYFLIIRSKIGNATYNSLLNNLKTQCPFIYEVAVYMANLIQETFYVVIADSEIGFLALVLGGMLEQDQDQDEKLKTVIVCGLHNSIGEQIQRQLSEKFSSDLDFLGALSQLPHNAYESRHILFLSCLSEPVPYHNVLTIGSIISERDIRHIERYISEYRHNMERVQFRNLAKDFFDEKLFFHNKKFKDKYEIIRFLSGKVVEEGYADETFTEEVLHRERISSTCFMEAFAIPHSLSFSARRSAFCILSCDYPIPWDKRKIKFVCLLVLSQNDRSQFHSLYQHLVNIFFDMQSLSSISEAPDFETFMERVNQLF